MGRFWQAGMSCTTGGRKCEMGFFLAMSQFILEQDPGQDRRILSCRSSAGQRRCGGSKIGVGRTGSGAGQAGSRRAGPPPRCCCAAPSSWLPRLPYVVSVPSLLYTASSPGIVLLLPRLLCTAWRSDPLPRAPPLPAILVIPFC